MNKGRTYTSVRPEASVMCDECGALVMSTMQHDQWHDHSAANHPLAKRLGELTGALMVAVVFLVILIGVMRFLLWFSGAEMLWS